MLFKIPALKVKKAILALFVFILTACVLLFLAVAIDENDVVYLVLLLFPFLGLALGLPFMLVHLESFEVYEEKILVKNPFGVYTEVYFEKVTEVFETELQAASRYSYVKCFVFSDGRKLNRVLLSATADNSKNICVRVPVTDELKELIAKKGIKVTETEIGKFIYL